MNSVYSLCMSGGHHAMVKIVMQWLNDALCMTAYVFNRRLKKQRKLQIKPQQSKPLTFLEILFTYM